MSNQRDTNGGSGLSVQTLVIASLSSLAAALVVHKFWQGGAILGAAVTPIIVALVSEALHKPAQAISSKRTAVEPPPLVVPERADRFGIWEEQKKRAPRRRLHIGLAVATGLVAFAIAAFFLTGAELVLGGASDSDRFRFVPGKQQKKDSDRDRDRDAPAQTDEEEAEPAPEEEEEAAPTVTVTEPPAETVPEEAPPEETTPEEAPAPDAPETTTPVP